MENQERDDEDDERERKAIIKRKCRMLNVFQTAKICMWRGEVKGKTMQMKHESVRSPAYAVAASAPPLLDASFVFGIVCSAVQWPEMRATITKIYSAESLITKSQK